MESKHFDTDYYAKDLAKVNNNNQDVMTDEIYSESNIITTPIDSMESIEKFIMDRITQQNLSEYANVEEDMTGVTLKEEFDQFLSQYPDLKQIHHKNNFECKLKHLCTVKPIPRLLLQKLATLKAQLPVVFNQTLFTTWLASLMSSETQLSLEQCYSVFFAGLMHDLGFLYIDPKILKKEGDYTKGEWEILMHHMAISKAIAQSINAFDDEVYKAIMEHHERCDGTGYPNGLQKESLSLCGQIIGLADILCHIRMRQMALSGKDMADIMPYIQINANTYMYESYQAMYAILNRANLSVHDLINRKDFATLPDRLIKQRIIITELYHELLQFIEHIPDSVKSKLSRALIDSTHQIEKTILRSGLSSAEIIKWLEGLSKADFEQAHIELQDIEFLQYELLWRIKKSARLISPLLDEEISLSSKNNPQIIVIANQIEKNLQSAWKDYN